MNLPAWLIRWQNRRGADRSSDPGIVAFFWDGGHPRSNPLRDISLEGAFLETTGTWYVGTIVSVTLQCKTSEPGGVKPLLVPKLSTALPIYRAAAAILDETASAPRAGASIRMACRIVRQDRDGIAVQFLENDSSNKKMLRKFISACMVAKPGASSGSVRQARCPQNDIPPLLLQLRNGSLTENSR